MFHSSYPLVILSLLIYQISCSSLLPSRPHHHVRRAIDHSVLLGNGQAAQKLNAKFSSMTTDSACQTGDSACIAGGFYQCVGGKFVGGPCAQGLKCFAMPLLLRKGTSLGCDTEADAKTRISDTGATGGLTGTDAGDSSTASNSTAATSSSDNKNTNGTAGSDSTEKGDDTNGSTQTDSDTGNAATAMNSPSDAQNSGKKLKTSTGSAGDMKNNTPVKDGDNAQKKNKSTPVEEEKDCQDVDTDEDDNKITS